MKKINTYPAQYKLSRTASQNNPHSFAIKTMQKIQQSRIRKKLSKDRQEIINNIFASGFKQFQV